MGKVRTAYKVLTGQLRDADFGSMLGDGSRQRRSLSGAVTQDSALKNSVWWRGLALRANIMSTFPLDVVRSSGGILVPVANPGTMISEPYPGIDITQHLYGRQMDVDRIGNSVGIITARNFNGLPTAVELQPMSLVSARMDGRKIKQWKIDGKYYDPRDIWHETQYTMAGMSLGLSPLAYASWSMGIYQSAQEFAIDWFGNGALPRGVLRNTKRDKIPAEVRQNAKQGFKESTQNGDIFVTGVEWEWLPAQTTAMSAGFLDQKASSEKDVARYVGVPAGMLDVEISTGNITYANATQANLQFLVTELGPAVVRLQNFWSRNAFPKPWQLRVNTDALLRMDPLTKSELLDRLNKGQLRTKTELRALDNLGEYTPADLSELALFAQMSKPAPTAPQQKNEDVPWLIPS